MKKCELNPKHRSFVLYFDQAPMFEALTDEEAGKLIKLIMGMANEPCPLINNSGIKVAFAQIQNRIFENDKKWTGKDKKATISITTRWLKENQRRYDAEEITKDEFLSTKKRLQSEIERISDELDE